MIRFFNPAAMAHADRAGLILTREESAEIARRALAMQNGPGDMRVGVGSTWEGNVRWARNRLTAAGDARNITIRIQRSYGYNNLEVQTSRIDDEGLRDAAATAEDQLRDAGTAIDPDRLPPRRTDFPSPRIWSDNTTGFAPEGRAKLAADLLAPAAQAALWSAGYLGLSANSASWFGTDREAIYATATMAQCSLTVRSQQGSGSGWAGFSSYDWNAIDATALATRARMKCETSKNPSALEPGHYTVVLEPQAVADLLDLIMQMTGREPAEMGYGPFADRPGFSKLGKKVVDSRITLTSDPADPLLGTMPFDDEGEPQIPATWIDRGVLTALAYGRRYAVNNFNENQALPWTSAVRMSGGTTSIDEMISTTKRGLLVTRFFGCQILDSQSLLSTGHTRDGLWLIENGKITRPVKNFRFTDSPLFMLNSVEALGTPVPVFHPTSPMIVPPIKSTSFNFTRLADAV